MAANKQRTDFVQSKSNRSSSRSVSRHRDNSPADPPLAPDRLTRIDWHELELVLHVIEAGSVRAGAARTGHAIGTIRRRLGRIEDKLGAAIAERSATGFILTRAGKQLVQRARDMERSWSSAERAKAGEVLHGRERVRIAVTEGLGTYWLMPRLVEFQERHPHLDVELICDMRAADILSDACDIAVQLEAPPDGAQARRIGTLHLMPFASDRYLQAAGVPQSIDDWPRHRLVWQEAEQVASHLLPYFLGTADPAGLIALRTNTSSAHFRAVASGGGIGILPTYARAVSRRVRPLDLELHPRREIFCLTSGRQTVTQGVQSALDWLAQSFDGDLYPWFRDDFVHPRDFEQALSSPNVISLFEGFIDALDADEAI